MDIDHKHLRQAVVESSLEAESLRLNVGTSGNISARIEGGMIITPTGIAPRALTLDLIVRMDLEGAWAGSVLPSTEWALHAEIYKARPEVLAIVHAHPDHCVALSCARRSIPAFHYMIAGFGGDDVRCSNYATFGSRELALETVAALDSRTACLLSNHGMVAVGTTIKEALSRALKLETLARQFILCRSIDTPVVLTAAELIEVAERYKTYGKQPNAAN